MEISTRRLMRMKKMLLTLLAENTDQPMTRST
ncbi:MAG: hypothetical protein H6733_06025 [Alphaproteobacteria bacterium]|nr:hypothetical protein [Alphaproteobacteria bacterium]